MRAPLVRAVNGNPIVNVARFPSLKNMTNHAHKLGLTAGWYGAYIRAPMNEPAPSRARRSAVLVVSAARALQGTTATAATTAAMQPSAICRCHPPLAANPRRPYHDRSPQHVQRAACNVPLWRNVRRGLCCASQVKQDVAALIEYGFDSWKLDGCGGEMDLVVFNKYITAAGKRIMVEKCHGHEQLPFTPDPTLPPAQGCPWNFYRSSGDVRASYASILSNLATTFPLHAANLSYPGCWACVSFLLSRRTEHACTL